jgi:hypothetical protein
MLGALSELPELGRARGAELARGLGAFGFASRDCDEEDDVPLVGSLYVAYRAKSLFVSLMKTSITGSPGAVELLALFVGWS